MTFSRVTTFVFLACFSLAVFLQIPHAAEAQGPEIRPAATIAAPAPVVRPDFSPSRHRTRIGLAPEPFNPESVQPERRNTMIHSTRLPDIREMVKRINRSVVSIRMLDGGTSWPLGTFGISGKETTAKAMGYGSGFIVSPEGYIVTNEHVLRNGNQIEVELLGGQKYMAKVIHKDKKNDLALLKIDPSHHLSAVSLGDSNAVELGEWVVGIGNPYGIGQSLMIGIVSAKQRRIPGSGYPPLIQVDAAMNLGNSGGPLFNLDGQVIGINTILLWKSQGIGFATPINVAKEFLDRTRLAFQQPEPAQASATLQHGVPGPRATARAFNPFDPPWKLHQ